MLADVAALGADDHVGPFDAAGWASRGADLDYGLWLIGLRRVGVLVGVDVRPFRGTKEKDDDGKS